MVMMTRACYLKAYFCIALRGISPQLVVIDEAMFINPETLKNVILPLGTVRNTVTLFISSVKDDNCYLARLMRVKNEEGEPEILSLRVRSVCDVCLKKDPKLKECAHAMARMPEWKSAEAQRKAERLAAANNDGGASHEMENLGLMSRANDLAFTREHVEDAFDWAKCNRPVSLAVAVAMHSVGRSMTLCPVVWIGIDPANGGKSSDYSIVSLADFAPKTKRLLIAGADATSSDHEGDCLQMVRDHLTALRKQPALSRSVFVVFMEANSGYQRTNAVRDLCESGVYGTCYVAHSSNKISESTGRTRAGMITDPVNKILFKETLEKLMKTKELVCLPERHDRDMGGRMWSHGKPDPDIVKAFPDAFVSSNAKKCRTTLAAQTQSFEDRVIPGKNGAKDKRLLDGKRGGRKDDMTLALQIGVYWRSKFLYDPTVSDLVRQESVDPNF